MNRAFVLRLGATLSALVAFPSLAAAAEPGDEQKRIAVAEGVARGPAEEPEDFGHFGQVGLRAGAVFGYRMVFRYDDSPFCETPDLNEGGPNDQSTFCDYAATPAIDVALSFAVLDAIEPFAWARFGLGADDHTDTEAVQAFGVGVRFYTMSDSQLKLFVQPAAAMSIEGSQNSPSYDIYGTAFEANYDTDLLVQLHVGPQFDFNEYVGGYASAGMTVSAIRYISANLEGQIGIQARYP